jgi:acetyl-CoA carboxylase biotin carboxyl carrier protein
MAENPSGPAKPIDVQRLHYLVRLMKRYDLTALDVSDGLMQIKLRRRSPHSGSVAPTQPPPSAFFGASNQSFGHQPTQPSVDPSPADASPAPKTVFIESPMVGTYYSSSAPDLPPFVSVGSLVQPNSIVCIIEAMKVFTDIPANVSGTVAEILVKNGQAVEYGQPLFRVIPA